MFSFNHRTFQLRRRRLARLASCPPAVQSEQQPEPQQPAAVPDDSPAANVTAGLDGKESVSENMDTDHEKIEPEAKSEFPELSSPLNKRLKNSSDSLTGIEEMDVVKTDIVKSSLTGEIDMEWDAATRRDSAKRQKACPGARDVTESPADHISGLIHPLFSRIFPFFDASVLQTVDAQIPDKDRPFYYMNCASAFLMDFVTNIFASDFTDLIGKLSPGLETSEPSKKSVWDTILVNRDKIGLSLFYLMQSYESIDLAAKDPKTQSPPLVDVLIDARSQCISLATLILTNTFGTASESSQSPLITFVLNSWHRDFLSELLASCYKEHGTGGDFRLIFEPLLLAVWQEMYSLSSLSKSFVKPLQALNELCDVTVVDTSTKRPICQLLVEMDNWIPEMCTNAPGRELTSLSFLSPFFSLSVFAEDDAKIVDEFYGSGKLSQETTKIVTSRLQALLSQAREEMFGIMHHMVLNSSSRDAVLSFIAEVMLRNEKRAQLQVDEKLVATDGFMLNMAFVLQKLSLKIKAERVESQYPFHSDALIRMRKQETRLKMVTNEAESWATGLKAVGEINFQTRCFFLALECHHLSLIPCMRKYTRRIRAIREYSRIAEELTQSQQVWSRSPAASRNLSLIRRWKEHAQRLAKAKTCADAGLLDQQLLTNTLRFYCLHMRVLLRSLGSWHPDTGFTTTLPATGAPSETFAAYPEWFVEDVADFLLFTIQHMPQVIDCDLSDELIFFLVILICADGCLANPYLVAKLIEVVFLSCPSVHFYTERFNQRLLSHPLAQKHLAKALMKFYTDVESTGASSEFYDKFTIRYHISVIFKRMWNHPVHQSAMIEESKNGDQFVRFVNMLTNDTTFLLDESLESLKRIHEIQDSLDRNESSNQNLSNDQVQSRQRQLANDERQCRSYLTLATETVDMFFYLTEMITEPFYRPVSLCLASGSDVNGSHFFRNLWID